MEDALLEIRKVHGTASIFRADEDYKANIPAITTGSFNLDDAIGVGGVPEGRLILWSGPESSGKTLLSLCHARRVQNEVGGSVVYIDSEYTFSKAWTAGLGIDLSKFYVAQTGSGVAAFELLLGKPKTKARKETVPGLLTSEKWKELGLKLIIVDSLNALQPPLEQNAETGAILMAPMSRFLPPELRRLTPILAERGVTCIFILQSRTNIGQMHGDPITVSGGKALMHAASLWIDCRKIGGSQIFAKEDTDEKEPIGHKIKAKIRKNKVSPPDREAELTIFYSRGIDIRHELADQGLKRDVIQHEGNTYKYAAFPNGKVIGMEKLQEIILGDKKVAKVLHEDIKSHRINSDKERKKELKEGYLDGEEPEEEVMPATKTGEVDDEQESSVVADPKTVKSEAVPNTEKASDLKEKGESLGALTKEQLLEKARALSISGVYKMGKEQLIAAITKQNKDK